MSWKKNKNKRAIAILRVSSKRQEGNNSHQVQEEKIRAYCQENLLELVEVRKIVESAKRSDERKKYFDAINFALKGDVQHVLFYMNDREARNLTDNEKNELLVLDGKIVIHYVNDRKVLEKSSPSSDFFMRDMFAVSNKNFSRMLSEKVNDVMRKKAQDGWFPGNRPPLGYVHQKLRDSSGREMKRGTVIIPDPNPRFQRIVKMEFELRAKGFTLDQIREKILQESLVEPSKTKSYSKHGIEARLKNKFYWGYFDWQGEEYQGKHELIIDKHTLNLVKASFGLRGSYRRTTHLEGIFSGGWIKCGDESCRLQVVYDPKVKKIKSSGEFKKFPYYRCSNSRKLHKSLKYVSEDKMWSQFRAVVAQVHMSQELAQRVSDALNALNEKAIHQDGVDKKLEPKRDNSSYHNDEVPAR